MPKKQRRGLYERSRPLMTQPPLLPTFLQDGTLLLTTTTLKAGWGPANADDWRYFNASVPGKLAALVEEGFEICVLR